MIADRAGTLTKTACLALSGALLLAAAVRTWQINESLWLDELHTSWVVAGPVSEISERARIGNQSPLYFWFVAATTKVCGSAEWTIRLPSLLAGLALVPVTFLILMRWTGSVAAATLSAALIALDRHCVFYAQEARPYAWVQFLGLLHVYQFWRLQQQPNLTGRVIIVGTGVLLFWLHYTSALLFLAEAGWYALLLSCKRTTYRPQTIVVDLACLATGIAPAIPHLLEIGSRRSQWSVFVSRDLPDVAVHWFSLIPYILIPLALAAFAFAVRRSNLRHTVLPRQTWTLVSCWFAIPVSLAWMLTWCDVTRLFFPRYLAVCMVAPIVAAGMLIALIGSRRARAAAAVFVLGFAAVHSGLLQQFALDGRFLADRNQDWRGAVDWLSREGVTAEEAIFVRSGLIEADQLTTNSPPLLRQYCVLPVTGLYRLADTTQPPTPLPTTKPIELSPRAAATIDRSSATWLIVNGNSNSRPRTVKEFIAAAGVHGLKLQVKQRRSFGSVLVVRVTQSKPPT